LYFAGITERHASIQKLKFFKQNKAKFTHKRKAAVSHGICTILLRWATEFCKQAHGTWWQNFPRKTVGPIYQNVMSVWWCFLQCVTVSGSET